jgi:hypothetical protein
MENIYSTENFGPMENLVFKPGMFAMKKISVETKFFVGPKLSMENNGSWN